jgi:multiple sugar transport system permease protein
MAVAQSTVSRAGAAQNSWIEWLKQLGGRTGLYLITLFLAFIFGFPLFWTVMSSLKTPGEMAEFPPPWLPAIPQWENYAQVLFLPRIPVTVWVWNSTLVTVLVTLGVLITSSLVAYSFARFEYRGRDFLFMITLATVMLPAQVTLIPQFVLFFNLGWMNSHLPLWVPAWFGGGAFAIFLMRQFFLTLPKDLDEAALIDGASYFRIFWSILLPLCKPVLATLAIITMIDAWSDFLGPLIYLNSPEKFTLAVGLRFFVNAPDVSSEPMDHLIMAACVMYMLPMMIIFFFGQRFFVQGIVMSGIKG